MKDIRIVAEITIRPGFKDELMPVFQALVYGSRAETGNKEYDLTESLENPDHFFVIETWGSKEAIAKHNESPHFQAFVKAIEGKVEKLTINKVKRLL